MSTALHLVLVIQDGFMDDNAVGELVDVLNDHIQTGNQVDLVTGESDQGGFYIDQTGEHIPCYVEKVGVEERLD